MSDLRDAIAEYDRDDAVALIHKGNLPEWVDELVTAARLVANPNIEAAAMALVQLLHEVPDDEIEDDWLYDMDEDTKASWLEWAKTIVAAAHTPQGDTNE